MYISNDPIWPFTSSGDAFANRAEEKCAKMGLSLALLTDPESDESVALKEISSKIIHIKNKPVFPLNHMNSNWNTCLFLGCVMKIPPKRSILIGEDPAGKCNFQKSDGTFETSEVS